MMVKSKRNPFSMLKSIRTFGGDCEVVFIEEATPLARLKRQVETAAKSPRVKGILLDILKK